MNATMQKKHQDDWFSYNVNRERLEYLNGDLAGPVAKPAPEEDPLDLGDQAASNYCGCGSPSCISPNVSDHELGYDIDAYETPDTE